jgi:multiple sugar transport system substrate-binding protein
VKKLSISLLAAILIMSMVALPVAAKVTIRVGRFANPWYDPVLESLFQDYEKANPDIKIQFETVPGEEYKIKLEAELAQGDGPDIFVLAGQWVPTFARDSRIAPMPETVARDLKDNFVQGAVDYAYWQGKYYGAPHEGGPRLYVYNQDIFDEVGLAGSPADWNELIEYGKKMTKFDSSGQMQRAGLGVNWGADGVCAWHAFLKSAGGTFFNEDQTQVKFHGPEGVRALQEWVDWIHVHHIADPLFLEFWDGFPIGMHGMIITGPWVTGYLQQTAPTMNYGAFVVPPMEAGGEQFADDAPWQWHVNSDTKIAKEAWDLIEFLMSHDVIYRLSAESGMAPFRKSVIESDAWRGRGPAFEGFANATYNIAMRPRVWWFEVERILGDYIEKALTKEATPEEALATAADSIQETIEAEIKVRGGWWY